MCSNYISIEFRFMFVESFAKAFQQRKDISSKKGRIEILASLLDF